MLKYRHVGVQVVPILYSLSSYVFLLIFFIIEFLYRILIGSLIEPWPWLSKKISFEWKGNENFNTP